VTLLLEWPKILQRTVKYFNSKLIAVKCKSIQLKTFASFLMVTLAKNEFLD